MRGWQIDAADEDYIFSLNHLPIVHLATGIIPLPSSEIHITFTQIFSSPRRNIFLTAVKCFNLRGGKLSSPRRKVLIPEEIRNDLCNNLAAAQPVVIRYATLHYVPLVPLNSPPHPAGTPLLIGSIEMMILLKRITKEKTCLSSCLSCFSLGLLGKAAALGQRPKGSC